MEMQERGPIGDIIIDNLSSGDAIFFLHPDRPMSIVDPVAGLMQAGISDGSLPTLARSGELDAIKIETNRK